MKNLINKVILITGSSRGMGAAAAEIAASRGATVVLHGKTESDELKSLAKKLKSDYMFCDVSDKPSVEGAIEGLVKKYGQIDAIINSAGIAKSKYFMDLDKEDWYEQFDINLVGTANVCQAAIPYMSEGASIVNISSIRGITNLGNTRNTAYCVSKAGVHSLTVGLAKEFGPKIRVNCIAPGGTLTEMLKNSPAEVQEGYRSNSALKRLAEPEDIAKIMLFLASDESSIMTGQILTADGGYEIYGK